MTPTVVAPAPGAESDAGAEAPVPGEETAGLQAARTDSTPATSAARAVRGMRMVILPSRGRVTSGGAAVVEHLEQLVRGREHGASAQDGQDDEGEHERHRVQRELVHGVAGR